jgi:hypothetical protein
MVSLAAAEEFHKKFHGKYLRQFSASAEKAIAILPADVQGFEENALKYASTMNQGKRTGQTKPVFFRPLPRHIEAKLEASKPYALATQQKPVAAVGPPMQKTNVAATHRLPQRSIQNPNQDVQELMAAVLQQALLPLVQASLSMNSGPQQTNFCCRCGKKRLAEHMFCGHCGSRFD